MGHHLHQWNEPTPTSTANISCPRIWMKAGTSSKTKYIPIHSVAAQFDAHVLSSLSAFHSLTGSDTSSFLAGHTKKSCWNVYKENHDRLYNLGKGNIMTKPLLLEKPSFVKSARFTQQFLWTVPGQTSFAQAHLLETLLPTHDALSFHIKRSHYQISVWWQADKQRPELPSPETMGWTIQSGALVTALTSLLSLSKSYIELSTCGCATQCRSNNCNCRKKRLPCTSVCICSTDADLCRNDYWSKRWMSEALCSVTDSTVILQFKTTLWIHFSTNWREAEKYSWTKTLHMKMTVLMKLF